MKRLAIADLPLAGLKRIERQRLGDARGFLSRLFCAEELAAAGWVKPVAQINQTVTAKRGTVRGLHFQNSPHAEMKLVSCLRGEVWDVAVDIRAGSKTFLHWHAERLSADNGRALLIPEGFAHGFVVLSETAELLYKVTGYYDAKDERCIIWNDKDIAIDWPLSGTPTLSKRDGEGTPLSTAEVYS